MTIEQLAAALNISQSHASKMSRQGMPRELEPARAWLAERAAGRGRRMAGVTIAALNEHSLDDILAQQHILVASARTAYRNAIESGDQAQSKLQTAFNQALKTLLSLEEEQKKRALANAEYISKAEALTAIKTLIGEVLSKLDDLPTDVAERCNKANPAQAIKPLQDWVRKTREEISSHDLLAEDA
jgi:hypothetical protein